MTEKSQLLNLRRRTILKWMSATGVVIALPAYQGCSDGSDSIPPETAGEPAHFLQARQRATLEALANTIIPEDATVGAANSGAVEYIDRYLAAFSADLPDIFRGGPFSGREPFPDPVTGAASDHFPDNRFTQVLPLSRMQELAFRLEFFGSAAIENGLINSPVVASWPGIQSLYQQALVVLDQAATDAGVEDFSRLSEAQQLAAFEQTDERFRERFLTHLAEGMFCAPEYGGNNNAVVWRDYYYDGDSQPLGHTLYDSVSQNLYDRADAPNQTIDEDAFNDPMSDSVLQFINAITLGQGGTRFF
ncbi:MAG: gluconate 2-dehydrogenase subunit 3 family protein [Halioglobus sp.]